MSSNYAMGAGWPTSRQPINAALTFGHGKRNDPGRWSSEEHEKFLHCMQKFGRDWPRIMEAVGTRNIESIRSHGQKVFIRLERQGIDPCDYFGW